MNAETPDNVTTPAGWYPDPTSENKLRWWDGAGWTSKFADQAGSVEIAVSNSEAETQTPGQFRRAIGKFLGVTTEQQTQARNSFDSVLRSVVEGTADLALVPSQLDDIRESADFRDGQDLAKRLASARALISSIAYDDYLDEVGDEELKARLAAIGLPEDTLQTVAWDAARTILVSRANAGRLGIVRQPRLLAKRDEIVHLEVPANLLKEVTIREYRGGYGGASFQVAKGVRFHTGGTRGSLVPVGTEIQVADTGTFSISNQRAVYLGARKNQEFRFDKLLGAQLYVDAITLQVSNRQNATTLGLGDPDLVAAYLNAAAQDYL